MATHTSDDSKLPLTSTYNLIDDYYSTATTNITNSAYNFTISEDGNTEFKNDIHVNGLGVIERLSIIESALGLPQRDAELEEKYPHLKDLYYAQVDAIAKVKEGDTKYTKEMEKLRTFEILNKDNHK